MVRKKHASGWHIVARWFFADSSQWLWYTKVSFGADFNCHTSLSAFYFVLGTAISPKLAECDITRSMLVQASPNGIPELVVVTNGIVLELADFRNQNSNSCTQQLLYEWIIQIYGSNWPRPDSPTCQAIVKSIDRLMAKRQKIRKMHSSPKKDDEISQFLQKEFILPSLGFRRGQVVHFTPVKKSKQTHSTGVVQPAVKELKQRMYARNRNANKCLKRREAIIQKQVSLIETQQRKIAECERKLAGSEHQLKLLKAKLDRVNHRAGIGKVKFVALATLLKQRKKCFVMK